MEKLWSPWRSQYIDSFKIKNSDKKCVLCAAADSISSDDNSLIIDIGKYTFTILNLYPYNNGHLMIVPKRHISDFISLTEDENCELMNKLQNATKALKIVYKPEGFNIGANIGKASGAGIDEHIHFHIVPRWNGDTNFMPVLGEVKIISQDLLVTKKRLIEAFNSLK